MLVRLVLCEVPGQLSPGRDGVPRRRPMPPSGELPAAVRPPSRASRVRSLRPSVARGAVRRLGRRHYFAQAFVYILAWAAWCQKSFYLAAWAGLAPSPHLRVTRVKK